jgi:hypothetical protein
MSVYSELDRGTTFQVFLPAKPVEHHHPRTEKEQSRKNGRLSAAFHHETSVARASK